MLFVPRMPFWLRKCMCVRRLVDLFRQGHRHMPLFRIGARIGNALGYWKIISKSE